MRRLIMWNLVTLDGLFEGPNKWDLDWHEMVWGDELEQFSLEQGRSAGMLLFGRVTYEGMAAYWSTAEGEAPEIAEMMNNLPKAVFSRTLERADWANTTLVKEPPEEFVRKRKAEDGGDLYVFGSADLSGTFIRKGLFDEYRLCLAPLVLGEGTPLFKTSPERLQLQLVDARPLRTGGVMLRYQPK